jgi:uncharacterized repeat protein (TIGR04138 family)
MVMPPQNLAERDVLQRVAADVGVYPIEAYEFVQRGLAYTVKQLHGSAVVSGKTRHVTGQQLCEGLRQYALDQWGMLARTVLRRWNITSTVDFGRIVFDLVEYRVMATTDQDTIEDFRGVYEFAKAFESAYRMTSRV